MGYMELEQEQSIADLPSDASPSTHSREGYRAEQASAPVCWFARSDRVPSLQICALHFFFPRVGCSQRGQTRGKQEAGVVVRVGEANLCTWWRPGWPGGGEGADGRRYMRVKATYIRIVRYNTCRWLVPGTGRCGQVSKCSLHIGSKE